MADAPDYTDDEKARMYKPEEHRKPGRATDTIKIIEIDIQDLEGYDDPDNAEALKLILGDRS